MAKIKKTEKRGEAELVFFLKDDLIGGSRDRKLKERIFEQVEEAGEKLKTVVFNIQEVGWISSPGLGILVTLNRGLFKKGIKCEVEEPNIRVLGILQVTRLNMIFDVIVKKEQPGALARSALRRNNA